MGAPKQQKPNPADSVRDDDGVTSLSLLELVQAHDDVAWQRLVHLYSPLILSWSKRSGVPDEDASDVLQEVWRAVAIHIDRFERTLTKGTFRGWLWTITRNKLRDHYRSKQGKAAAVGGTDAHTRLQEIPEDEPLDENGNQAVDSPRQFLYRALDLVRSDFEEKTWQAFWKVTVEGQPPALVARELGLSVDSVYQAKSRVLRRLRTELQGLVEWSAVGSLN